MRRIIIAALFLIIAMFSQAQIQSLFDITGSGSIAATATSASPMTLSGHATAPVHYNRNMGSNIPISNKW